MLRLLEGCACEGGATAGYQRAGWHVTAVDLDANRLKYNPADVTVHEDVLEYLRAEGHRFDALHLSPNCQFYSRGRAKDRGRPSKWERSIPTFRAAALESGLPYVIENVPDAGWDMRSPARLCGCMWDLSTIDDDGLKLNLQRPRLFETNWSLTAPGRCEGEGRPRWEHPSHEWVAGAYGGARRDKYEARYIRHGGYVPPSIDVVRSLLGVTHRMTWRGLFECIPPVYAEHVGTQLAAHVLSGSRPFPAAPAYEDVAR